jgi:hypothetical protein
MLVAMATNGKVAQYVQPNIEGGWDVLGEGHRRVSAHTATQTEAIDRARQIVKDQGGGEILVMNEYGKLVERDTVRRPRLYGFRHRRRPASLS